MSRRLQQKKRALVAQSSVLRNDLARECGALSEGYRGVVERVAGAVALVRMARLTRRIASLFPPRRPRERADNGATDQ